MKSCLLILAGFLVAGSAGCLFEPECDSYEACTVPEDIDTTDAGADANQPANNASNLGNNGVVEGACQLPQSQCPDEDFLNVGGSPTQPLGCDRSGNLDFFDFAEEADVCAGGPRGYRAVIESCDSPYILVANFRPTDGCVQQGAVEFDLAGLECGDEDVFCGVEDGVIQRSFLIHPDRIGIEQFEVLIDANHGGFSYVVEIYSRR